MRRRRYRGRRFRGAYSATIGSLLIGRLESRECVLCNRSHTGRKVIVRRIERFFGPDADDFTEVCTTCIGKITLSSFTEAS